MPQVVARRALVLPCVIAAPKHDPRSATLRVSTLLSLRKARRECPKQAVGPPRPPFAYTTETRARAHARTHARTHAPTHARAHMLHEPHPHAHKRLHQCSARTVFACSDRRGVGIERPLDREHSLTGGACCREHLLRSTRDSVQSVAWSLLRGKALAGWPFCSPRCPHSTLPAPAAIQSGQGWQGKAQRAPAASDYTRDSAAMARLHGYHTGLPRSGRFCLISSSACRQRRPMWAG